jgi:hypothetical protein
LLGAAWPALPDEEVVTRDVFPAAGRCCPAARHDAKTVPNMRTAAIANIGDRLFVPVNPASLFRRRSVAGGMGVSSELVVTYPKANPGLAVAVLPMLDFPSTEASAVQACGSDACAQDCLEASPVSPRGIAPHAISRTDPVTISRPSAHIRHTRRMAFASRSCAVPECRVNRRSAGFV